MIARIVAAWLALPAPLRASIESAAFSANTVIGTAYAISATSGEVTLPDFVRFLGTHWFGLVMGAVYGAGAASAKRAQQAAAGTFPTTGGSK